MKISKMKTGNAKMKQLNQWPSFDKTATNCFIKPNFKMFFLWASG